MSSFIAPAFLTAAAPLRPTLDRLRAPSPALYPRLHRSCSPRTVPRAVVPTAFMFTTILSTHAVTVPSTLSNLSVLLAVNSPALDAAKLVAGPGINLFNFIMIIRIILTWYPKTDLAKSPWIFIAVPTEPLLRATRKVVPPVGGVDISPIVWFAIMSFVHEILVGPQGLLVLLSQK